jgi:hypothetical protein
MIGATTDVFSHNHIALTAAITGLIAAGIALWRFNTSNRVIGALTVGALAAAAVFLWRASANMPQLNRDGLEGFSANDWLAPVVTYIVLSVYADLFPPTDQHRFAQVRAAATIAALAVNVITI